MRKILPFFLLLIAAVPLLSTNWKIVTPPIEPTKYIWWNVQLTLNTSSGDIYTAYLCKDSVSADFDNGLVGQELIDQFTGDSRCEAVWTWEATGSTVEISLSDLPPAKYSLHTIQGCKALERHTCTVGFPIYNASGSELDILKDDYSWTGGTIIPDVIDGCTNFAQFFDMSGTPLWAINSWDWWSVIEYSDYYNVTYNLGSIPLWAMCMMKDYDCE